MVNQKNDGCANRLGFAFSGMENFQRSFGLRLRAAAQAAGLSVVDVAEKMQIGHSSVSHYFNGRSAPSYETLIRFSELTGTTVQDLINPASEASGNVEPADITSGDFVQIPVRNVELSAGSGAYPTDEEIIGQLAFRADWLRDNKITQGEASICRVFGDSMAPTIMSDDMVLIDHRRTSPIGKQVYAIRIGDELLIKRIEVNLDDLSLFVHSDNPAHRTLYIPADKRDENPIIGKVVWSARTWPA